MASTAPVSGIPVPSVFSPHDVINFSTSVRPPGSEGGSTALEHRSLQSGISDTPHKTTMESFSRKNSRAYKVEDMARLLKSELKGRNFNNLGYLPAVLFPPESRAFFPFDEKDFIDPYGSGIRFSTYETSNTTAPGFLKDHFLSFELSFLRLRRNAAPSFEHIRGRSISSIDDVNEEEDDGGEDDEEMFEIEEGDEIDDDIVVESTDAVANASDTSKPKPLASDELQVQQWLNNIISNSLTLMPVKPTPRPILSDFYAKPLVGVTPEKRKPDVVITNGDANVDAGNWARIAAVIEITRTINFPTRTRKAAAQRAVLILKNSPGRRFVPIILISDRQFMVVVFHRSGVSYSKKFDIVEEMHIFIYVIVGLCCADSQYLGYDPAVTFDPTTGLPATMTFKHRILYIKKHPPPVVKEGITGRGTVCFFVVDMVTGEEFAVKVVWADDKQETSEVEYFTEFAQKRIKGVQVLVDSMDCVCRNGEADSTAIWNKSKNKKFVPRVYRKLLLAGVGQDFSQFRTKNELLGALEDVAISVCHCFLIF